MGQTLAGKFTKKRGAKMYYLKEKVRKKNYLNSFDHLTVV